MAPMVSMVQLVILMVQRALLETKVQKDRKVIQVDKMVRLDPSVIKEIKDHKDHKDHKDRKVFQAQKVIKGHKDQPGEQKDRKGLRVNRDLQVILMGRWVILV